MAVCNLFKDLTNPSGNFLMFSQYVEDITHNYVESDTYKVIPTRFVALDIDYSKINKRFVLTSDELPLNKGIPKFFQNCFENACAYGRKNYSNWKPNSNDDIGGTWNPEISRNLFWNYMFDGGFITSKQYGSDAAGIKYIPEVKYFGDISMHSYNEHQGMGYGEIYCYIPSSAEQMNCQVVQVTDEDINARQYDSSNKKVYLEGYDGQEDKSIVKYPQVYYYNRDFTMTFDDDNVAHLQNSSAMKYNINTIVVLYSIFEKVNDNWEVKYGNLPMGMYFTGNFENYNLTNTVLKHVNTSYGTGTSYGLRICTRFSATSNGAIYNTDIIADDSGYTNVCQLMTAMNENLSKMLEVTKTINNTTQLYKDVLSTINNNRINVPYVKNINGTDCWFVNGMMIATVEQGTNGNVCGELSVESVKQRLDKLEELRNDNDPTNDYKDYTYIDDPNGINCIQIPSNELAEYLNLSNADDWKDPIYENPGCGCDNDNNTNDNSYEVADNDTVRDILEFETEIEGNDPIPEEPTEPDNE